MIKKLFLLAIISMFFLAGVLAFEFDNVLNVETQPNDYPILHIDNAFGFGDRLATLILQENSNECLLNCYAIINITLYDDMTFMEEFTFYTRTNKPKIQDYNVYYQVRDSEDILIDDYGTQCETINNTEICSEVKTGSHIQELITYDWKKYEGEELPPGNYLIKVESKKDEVKLGDSIDWAFSIAGISSEEIKENWAWWDTNWRKRRNINITGGVAELTDYPILLNITYDSDMSNNFSDIRFVEGACSDAQTNELPYEIDNKINASYAMVWVKIPTLAATTTDICMYYDNAGAINGENAKDVWVNYVMVYHFNDHGLSLKDSSSTNTNGTANGDPSYNPYGRIGGSYYFDGNDYFETTGATTPHPTGTITIEVFGNTTTASAGSNFWISQFESASGTAVGGIIQWTGTADIRFSHDSADDAENTWDSGIDYTVNDYDFITAVWADGSQVPFVNKQGGVEQTDTGANWNYAANARFFIGDWKDNAALAWLGDIDELRVSNVSRSSAWINRTYDITDFTLIGVGEELTDITGLTVSLDYPNGLVIGDTFTLINASLIPVNVNLTNSTAFVWNSSGALIFSEYQALTGNETTSVNATPTSLSDGLHYWNFKGCYVESDTGIGNCSMSGTNRSFTIDTTIPTLTIVQPPTDYATINSISNVSFNVSIIEPAPSDCWYYNDSANVSITCGNNASIQFQEGYHTLIYYANDTSNNLAQEAITFLYNYVRHNLSYSASRIENQPDYYYFNVTATNISTIMANITVNNTDYTMNNTYNNGTYATFYANITAPTVTVDKTIILSVNYTINNNNIKTGNYSQFIYNIQDINVSTSCTDKAIKFSLINEENFTSLNGTFQYNILYGLPYNNTLNREYGEISGVTVFYLCINSTISSEWEIGEAEIDYQVSGYTDRRYYLYSGTQLTNQTQNITLYNLPTSLQTSFRLEVEDTSLNPYTNKYTTLIRYYPDLNEYNVVDMGLTDENGDSVIHVRTEDVDYRIGVYEKNGTLIYLASPTRMVCLVSPCTYTLKISPTETDYTSFLNIDYTFTYNNTLGLWSFVFSDSSQTVNTMNLTVYKMTGSSVYPICTSSITGSSGAVSCNTSAYTGQLKGVVSRSASPLTVIAQKIVNTDVNEFQSSFGLYSSILIALPIAFIFASMSPIGAIIGGVIALIPALYFGSVNWSIVGGFAIMGGIVMHFLKRIG